MEEEGPQQILERALNQPPRNQLEIASNQNLIKQNKKGEYKYLKPSERIKTGFFKFDELRDTMVTKGLFAALTTFYPEVKKYTKQHPKQKRQPESQDQQQLERQLKILKPNFKEITQTDIRYTWIGHSTAVIQVGPDNLIIDPVFADRASPFQWVGPKRFRRPACLIPQLPKIDMVLISHDHYDHLDECALKQLQQHFKPVFVAGKGSENVMPEGSNQILMDWMDTVTRVINNRPYRVTFVPVCHWSKRGLNDLNTRLWGGFVIETPFNQKIFYSGDTGYCGVFKEIGEKYGPFDLTILPIGAYEPRSVLKPQHINPEQAVIVHKQLRSRQSVGVHWGTFPLGAEGYFQAKQDLRQARKKHLVPDREFITIYHGESIVFEKDNNLKK